MTEAHVCEQLAQSCYLMVKQLGIEPAAFRSDAATITPQSYISGGAKKLPELCVL